MQQAGLSQCEAVGPTNSASDCTPCFGFAPNPKAWLSGADGPAANCLSIASWRAATSSTDFISAGNEAVMVWS